MGWAIFFLLITIGLFGMGVESFVNGDISTGFAYITIPIVFFVAIIIIIVAESKRKEKIRAEINKIDNEIEKWENLAKKVKTAEFGDKDLFDAFPKVVEQLGYLEIEKEEGENFSFLRARNPNQKKIICIIQNTQSLDFDSLAELMEIVKNNRQNDVSVFYIFINEFTKNVYENLMVKCFESIGAYVYNKETFVEDIKTVINKLQERSNKKLAELMPQTQARCKKTDSNGRYKKIFPHMLSKDSDPDYLKQIDDWEWMDGDF